MNFTQALDRSLEDVQRPANLPTGHYIWQVTKMPEIDSFDSNKTGNKFDRVTFQVTCVSATDDVDPDELADYGNVQGALNRKSFLFSNAEDDKNAFDRSMFNLKRFLEHCGVEMEGKSVSEGLADAVNTQFIGELNHRPDPNDPEVIYAEIGRTAAI